MNQHLSDPTSKIPARVAHAIAQGEFGEVQRLALLAAFAEIFRETNDMSAAPRASAPDLLAAITDLKQSLQNHADLKSLELRIAFEKANADMLFKLGGVILTILVIAIASARYMGLVY